MAFFPMKQSHVTGDCFAMLAVTFFSYQGYSKRDLADLLKVDIE